MRTPAELIAVIEDKGSEVARALAELKGEAGLGVPEDAPFRELLLKLAKHQQEWGYLVRYKFAVVSDRSRHDLIIHSLQRDENVIRESIPIFTHLNSDPLVMWERRGLIEMVDGGIEREHGVFVLSLGVAQATPLVQVNVSGGNVINAQRDVNVGRDVTGRDKISG